MFCRFPGRLHMGMESAGVRTKGTRSGFFFDILFSAGISGFLSALPQGNRLFCPKIGQCDLGILEEFCANGLDLLCRAL